MSYGQYSATLNPTRTVTTPLRVLDLTAEFLADSAYERGPWPALLRRWGVARGLTDEEIGQVQAAVCRSRITGAMPLHRGRR
jgi:hypothetical protein